MKSLDVVIPVFNRDPAIVEYVIADFLKQDVDNVVIANTGKKRLGLSNSRVVEVHQSLPQFYPGITRNMGAVVSNAEVQVHSGADILTVAGNWSLFRAVQDDEMVCGRKCYILSCEAENKRVFAGERSFLTAFCHSPNNGALQALTKKTMLFRFKGYDWQMRGWGNVDTDMHVRADCIGVRRRWVEVDTLHLYHDGGCCQMVFKKPLSHSEDYKRNFALKDEKVNSKGWWSLK